MTASGSVLRGFARLTGGGSDFNCRVLIVFLMMAISARCRLFTIRYGSYLY